MKSLEDKIAQVQPRPNNLVFVLGSMLESMLHSTLKSRHYVTTPLRWVEPTCCALGPSKCGVQASGTVHSVRVAVVTMPAVDINSPALSKYGSSCCPIEEHFLQLSKTSKTTLATMCLCASSGSNDVFSAQLCTRQWRAEFESHSQRRDHLPKKSNFWVALPATLMEKLAH